jgi:ankyrin repeat protein
MVNMDGLLLVKVELADEYQVTPLHMAAKYGVVDTARELLDHGADKDRCSADIAGRGALHYAHTPDMIRSRTYCANCHSEVRSSHRPEIC